MHLNGEYASELFAWNHNPLNGYINRETQHANLNCTRISGSKYCKDVEGVLAKVSVNSAKMMLATFPSVMVPLVNCQRVLCLAFLKVKRGEASAKPQVIKRTHHPPSPTPPGKATGDQTSSSWLDVAKKPPRVTTRRFSPEETKKLKEKRKQAEATKEKMLAKIERKLRKRTSWRRLRSKARR